MTQTRKILILTYASSVKGSALKEGKIFSFLYRPTMLGILIRLLKLLGYQFMTVSQAIVSGERKICCLVFDSPSERTRRKVFPVLHQHGVIGSVYIHTDEQHLSWDLLGHLNNHGWEIGSEGGRHVNLTEISTEKVATLIRESKKRIQEVLGISPKSFLYPMGAFDTTVLKELRENGFSSAVSSKLGVNFNGVYPYALVSFPLKQRRIATFLKLLYGIFRRSPKKVNHAFMEETVVLPKNIRA